MPLTQPSSGFKRSWPALYLFIWFWFWRDRRDYPTRPAPDSRRVNRGNGSKLFHTIFSKSYPDAKYRGAFCWSCRLDSSLQTAGLCMTPHFSIWKRDFYFFLLGFLLKASRSIFSIGLWGMDLLDTGFWTVFKENRSNSIFIMAEFSKSHR